MEPSPSKRTADDLTRFTPSTTSTFYLDPWASDIHAGQHTADPSRRTLTHWLTANPESPWSTMVSSKTISTSNVNSKPKGTGSFHEQTPKWSRTWLRNISARGLVSKKRFGKPSTD